MAILFAFCCLGCAAVNDFVFKLFARKGRSRGLFVLSIGMVWLALLALLPWSAESNVAATWLWGSVSGFFSAAANLLLIEAMGHEDAGTCSTVYRLNLVLVVLGACLFLGESLGALQFAGIALAVTAVLAFAPARRGLHTRNIGFDLVIAAAVLRAGMGLTYKYGFLAGADRNGVTLVNSLFWIAGGALYWLLRERHFPRPGRKMLGYGALSGVLVAGIVFFMAASVQAGEASVVLPIAQMSFLGTFALSALFLRERLTRRKVLAILAGLGAVILLTVGN